MFCSNCGIRILDGANFCPSCGTKTLTEGYSTSDTQANDNSLVHIRKESNINEVPYLGEIINSNAEIKTILDSDERILICHEGTYEKVGFIILTNKRLIFEKSKALNTLVMAASGAIGLFTILGKDYFSIPLIEIKDVQGKSIPLSSNQAITFKIADNGVWKKYYITLIGFNTKKIREYIVQYIQSVMEANQ